VQAMFLKSLSLIRLNFQKLLFPDMGKTIFLPFEEFICMVMAKTQSKASCSDLHRSLKARFPPNATSLKMFLLIWTSMVTILKFITPPNFAFVSE
jgi:hypothetical protein